MKKILSTLHTIKFYIQQRKKYMHYWSIATPHTRNRMLRIQAQLLRLLLSIRNTCEYSWQPCGRASWKPFSAFLSKKNFPQKTSSTFHSTLLSTRARSIPAKPDVHPIAALTKLPSIDRCVVLYHPASLFYRDCWLFPSHTAP